MLRFAGMNYDSIEIAVEALENMAPNIAGNYSFRWRIFLEAVSKRMWNEGLKARHYLVNCSWN